MNGSFKCGLAALAVVGAMCTSAPVFAADLNYGGSLKDTGYTPQARPAGPCYARADVGFAWSRDPDVQWPVHNEVFTGDADADGFIGADEISYVFAGDDVSSIDMENTWVGEVGVGCGQGSRGWRGEMMFGFRGDQQIDGIPAIYDGTRVGDPVGTTPPEIDDPLHTSVQSYTLMFNLYRDLGRWGPVVPYVGAGIGVAYNITDEVYFTENPNLVNRIEGDKELSLAWSVMAGVAYQVSSRAILDLGYRYIDLGEASSGRVDNAGFVNPEVEIDDLGAHELKVGLRYHFGSSGCCASAVAMK